MADPRIKVRPPSDDPQRPPKGLASGSTPEPPVIFVQPEIIAALDRIATAFEQTATALAGRAPVDVMMPVMCGEDVYRRDSFGLHHHVCTLMEGHEPGHVARNSLGDLLACETCTGFKRETTGLVCQTCGTDYAAGS